MDSIHVMGAESALIGFRVPPDFHENLVCNLFCDGFIAHEAQDEAEYFHMMALEQQPDGCLLLIGQAIEKGSVVCAFNHQLRVQDANIDC